MIPRSVGQFRGEVVLYRRGLLWGRSPGQTGGFGGRHSGVVVESRHLTSSASLKCEVSGHVIIGTIFVIPTRTTRSLIFPFRSIVHSNKPTMRIQLTFAFIPPLART